ncbi:hypothetical protein GOP47_0005943 [Adiantum capillus-veneris]|uniref:Uncharacterized protein n=1 Tax=Adiantum capillus-veneris TaxID=13818 RepID=A0A9D4V2U1_ADICA|nr:hypothetical protein GOP47_0005943 [Adiantum capillus-veneris]
MCTGCSIAEAARHPKDDQICVPHPVKECPRHFEKALDTTDLSFWMYTVVPDGSRNQEEESYANTDSEELERRATVEKVPEKVVTTNVDDHGPLETSPVHRTLRHKPNLPLLPDSLHHYKIPPLWLQLHNGLHFIGRSNTACWLGCCA